MQLAGILETQTRFLIINKNVSGKELLLNIDPLPDVAKA